MSTTELILNNPLILISLAVTGLILLATSGLALFLVVRSQRRQSKHKAELTKIIEQAVEYDDEDDMDDTIPAPPIPRIPPGIKKPVPVPETRKEVAAPVASGDVPVDAPAIETEIMVEASTEEGQEPVSDVMQDILSDVFVNEDAARRYAILMKDKPEAEAADVLDLSRGLMARLAQSKAQSSKNRTES